MRGLLIALLVGQELAHACESPALDAVTLLARLERLEAAQSEKLARLEVVLARLELVQFDSASPPPEDPKFRQANAYWQVRTASNSERRRQLLFGLGDSINETRVISNSARGMPEEFGLLRDFTAWTQSVRQPNLNPSASSTFRLSLSMNTGTAAVHRGVGPAVQFHIRHGDAHRLPYSHPGSPTLDWLYASLPSHTLHTRVHRSTPPLCVRNTNRAAAPANHALHLACGYPRSHHLLLVAQQSLRIRGRRDSKGRGDTLIDRSSVHHLLTRSPSDLQITF